MSKNLERLKAEHSRHLAAFRIFGLFTVTITGLMLGKQLSIDLKFLDSMNLLAFFIVGLTLCHVLRLRVIETEDKIEESAR